MNSQEHEQLSLLLKQLTEARPGSKDAEAENIIREACSHQPDAAYLLVQRVLLMEQALNNAKTRIETLQNQLQNNQSGTQQGGFLDNNPWSNPTANNAGAVPGISNYQMRNAAQSQQQAPTQSGSSFLSGGGSSFLGNLATTAAGVVAGSFLFQGIENLLGSHSSSAFGQEFGNQNQQPEIINNYFEGDKDQQTNKENDDEDYLASNDDNDYQDDDSSFFDSGDDSGWV